MGAAGVKPSAAWLWMAGLAAIVAGVYLLTCLGWALVVLGVAVSGYGFALYEPKTGGKRP